jgi:hypothetical protein
MKRTIRMPPRKIRTLLRKERIRFTPFFRSGIRSNPIARTAERIGQCKGSSQILVPVPVTRQRKRNRKKPVMPIPLPNN